MSHHGHAVIGDPTSTRVVTSGTFASRSVGRASLNSELDVALSALERSFEVRLIGTFEPETIWAPTDAIAEEWLLGQHEEFDQFPVRHGENTVGVLVRSDDHQDRTIAQAMRPLADGLIVSGDMPIANLIPELANNHFRLVLRGSRIDGLVTQSDLLKLPVRMLLFGLVTHAEACLRELVKARYPKKSWMKRLKDGGKAVEKQLAKLQDAHFEPDPIECTNLGDVIHVAKQGSLLSDDLLGDLDAVRILRNEVAHAQTYVSSPESVRTFVNRFDSVRRCIDSVHEILQAG